MHNGRMWGSSPAVPVPQVKLALVCSRQDCHMREDLRAARCVTSRFELALRWLGVGLLAVGLVVLLTPGGRDRYTS